MDEDVSKHNDESHPQLPDSQSNKVSTKVEDENNCLKVSDNLKELPRRSSNESNNYSITPNEKDTVDKCISVPADISDSKTDSSHIDVEKPEENGKYRFEKRVYKFFFKPIYNFDSFGARISSSEKLGLYRHRYLSKH